LIKQNKKLFKYFLGLNPKMFCFDKEKWYFEINDTIKYPFPENGYYFYNRILFIIKIINFIKENRSVTMKNFYQYIITPHQKKPNYIDFFLVEAENAFINC
jgi:hypothetical protein